ncbi:aminotransferase class I/II-fold pyridoxal phosphate-dependent enzyme [uncultured Psychrobacillus sp.]|uniref:threonine aldolase family protein n=1 Tax=uncultured Psychrobacillus sp. TaxID=1551585 RepID=UPI002617E337|nr:aminotransferase class I/II-fold pyridoxal phosphate-dependent enzyme [uncultured Psychrobacillus sp.]
MNDLKSSFNECTYYLSGHRNRDISVLKDALKDVSEDQFSDIYGNGPIIEDFQKKMAKLLGKGTSAFFPSGTMAQQIALRIWCDEKQLNQVAYHPLSHLEIHEMDGLKEIHQIKTILLADKDRVIELEDVKNLKEDIACLLLELPQREIGGRLPSFETLEQISAYCREKGIKLHLDGARLLEVLPYYNKTATEVCDLFDSVYISFYKGIGGIAGAILAGDEDFIEKSKVWRKRYGGTLISLYPYILSADYYFDKRAHKMEQYYQNSVELAQLFNDCKDIYTVPEIPVSNMFHVHFNRSPEEMAAILSKAQLDNRIGISSYLSEQDGDKCQIEISIGDSYLEIPKEQLEQLFLNLNEEMK